MKYPSLQSTVACACACLLAVAACSNKPAGGEAGRVAAKKTDASAAPKAAPGDSLDAPTGAERTPLGLATQVIAPGTGKDKAGPDDTIAVHVNVRTLDGKQVDTTSSKTTPSRFALPGLKLQGIDEALRLMVKGEKRRLWVPEAMVTKTGGPAPAGTLVVDIELQELKPVPKPVPAPPDVAAPPAGAERSKSGLAWKVLQKGTGTKHPVASSLVEVHYSGWTTDGRNFDSSVARDEPARFQLSGVIPGWTEGVQLMVEGEKRRFWIPQGLAYNGKAGKPKGMLVFDVDLRQIIEIPGGK